MVYGINNNNKIKPQGCFGGVTRAPGALNIHSLFIANGMSAYSSTPRHRASSPHHQIIASAERSRSSRPECSPSPIFACHEYPRHPLPLLRPRRRALHHTTRSVPPHVRKVQVLQPVELPHLGARRRQQLDELARSLPRLGQLVGRLAPLRAACLEVLHPARQLLVPTLERGAPEQLDHIPGTACAVAAPQRGAPAHTHTHPTRPGQGTLGAAHLCLHLRPSLAPSMCVCLSRSDSRMSSRAWWWTVWSILNFGTG